MRGLVNIRRRIKSVTSTEKITKAMELVATAKLKKWRDLYFQVKAFNSEMQKTIEEIVTNSVDVKSSFFEQNNVKSTLYFVITSNIGLCASYNANIIKLAVNSIDKENDLVYCIGQKGDIYFKRLGYNVIGEQFVSLDPKTTKEFVSYILSQYQEKKVGSVKIIYTNYVNPVLFEPVVYSLLPLVNMKKELDSEYEPNPPDVITYYPNSQEVLDYVIPLYLETMITSLSINSEVSEQAARRNAMENASDNAEEIISSLKIEYNKARQGAITQEINEIVAGANAD